MKSGPRESKLGELISSITRRDPSKRQIKPVNTENILLDDIEDESDDEYVYEGNEDLSDESDSGSSGDGDSGSADSDSGESCASRRSSNASAAQDPGDDDSAQNAGVTIISEAYPADLSQNETPFQPDKPRPANTLYSDRICMLCLGDQSNLNDEIIECDACKILVHEDCHKVYDDVFLSSSASSSDTDPWFCEPCLAGVENPHCELCPNLGGVFKRTDNNRWVHLLCALYTPGVAFNYSESLSEVTLTELPSKDWSSKECTLCEEKFFAWTGVCISCDAGLCKNFFHVTCAQREGLLAEPAYEENPSDPYFAQCRQHTDKQVAKARRRNYLTAVNRCRLLRQATEMEKKASASVDAMEDFGATGEVKSTFVLLDERLKRKLETFRTLYQIMLDKREVPYTRPTKAPLYLENSPVAMRLFMAKAVSLALPVELTGSSAVTEASKSTAPGCPVFCPDFISYVLEREKKLEELSKKLTSLESIQRELQLSDANISHNYNCLSTRLVELNSNMSSNRNTARRLLGCLSSILSGVKASESLEALLSSSETAESQGVVRTSESARSVSANDSQSLTVPGRQSQSTSAQCSQKRARKLPLSSSKRFRRSLIGTETIVIDDDLSPTGVTPTTANSAAVSTTAPDNIFHQCNICNGYRDQHLLTICETCKKAFHIACLDPPLSRVPKRSKLFAWQCSMCTIAVVNPNDVVTVDVNAPRQLRRSSAFIPPHAVATSAAPTLAAPMVRRRVQKSSARRPRNRARRSRAGARRRANRPIRVRAEAYPCQMDDDVIPAVAYPAISINPKADIDVNKVATDTVDVLAVSQELKHVDYEEEEDSEENTGNDSEDTCNSSGVAESEISDNRENDEENNDKEGDVVYANQRGRPNIKSTVLKRPRSTAVDSPAELCDKANSSDDELASLRGSKVKFVRIKDHESPEQSLKDSAPQRYVICQGPENAPKKSPTVSNFKIKIRKSTDI